jgi:hypothetical protein
VKRAFVIAMLSLCPVAAAKDLGLFYGEPTPAYAMYVAQANAAAEQCAAAGLIRDQKRSARFLRHFNNSTEYERYAAKDESFGANYETFRANYQAAWAAAPQDTRERFCAAYNGDVGAKEQKGLFKFAPQVMYFRTTFSPKTPESLARARTWAGILSITSAVLTSAATVSSARDSVTAAKAGDWETSNRLMAASRNFNEAGANFVAAANAAVPSMPDAPLISVLEDKDENGQPRLIRCPVIDHFFSFAAPPGSPIWTHYMSVHMPCRDPLATDVLSS